MAKQQIKSTWEPFWSSDVKIESGGRYPLGLNRFHNHMDSFLNRNIIYQANRLRYITYYCWAIGDISENEQCDNYAEYVEQFQRRENALALGLYLNGYKYTIHGSDKLGSIVKDGMKSYNTSFRLMKSVTKGAYDLYYAGTIYGFGFIESDERGFLVLTESGNEIYRISCNIYNNSEYYKNYKGAKEVPTKVLLEWGEINDLDNIRNNQHKVEREFYKKIVFYLSHKNVKEYRRDTFAFYLFSIDECSKKNVLFDDSTFFYMGYYSKYYDVNDKIKEFDIPEFFYDIHFYWRIYFGHSIFRDWIGTFFAEFLDYLKSKTDGELIDDFTDGINKKEFNETMSYFLQEKQDYLKSNIGPVLKIMNKPADIEDSFSEFSIYEDENFKTRSAIIAKMFLIMINLFVRYNEFRSDKRYLQIAIKLDWDLWFNRLFEDFPNIEKIQTKEFISTILKKYNIQQHNMIMFEKNDLRRCWFTVENNRYFFQANSSSMWEQGHFSTVISYLIDMGLVEKKNDTIVVMREGASFYKELLQEFYL